MISALYRIPKRRRKEVARIWGRRGLESQAKARIERGPDEDTLRHRAMQDRRGHVIREGVNYAITESHAWSIRHSLHGDLDQVDLCIDGKLWRTGSLRRAERAVRYSKWR